MAFVNLPPNLQDIFYSITDRIAKLETGPNQAMYTAESAQGSAAQASAEAAAAAAAAAAAQATASAASVQALAAATAAGIAQAQAVTAQAQATTAYNAAKASLQPSASTIVNASNQMTAIASNGITVYSGSSATSGSRVVMNSLGLAAYAQVSVTNAVGNGSTVTYTASGHSFGIGTTVTITGLAPSGYNGTFVITDVVAGSTLTVANTTTATLTDSNGFVEAATLSISASTGNAVFSGSVTGSAIIGGTLNISGKSIIDQTGLLTATGATITGTINALSGYFGTPANGWSISTTGLVGVGSGTIVGGVISGAQFINGSGTFSVSPAGYLIAQSGQIGGSTFTSTSITGGIIQTSSGSNAVVLDGANNALGIKYGGTYAGWLVGIGSGQFMMHYGTAPDIVSGYPRTAVSSTTALLAANASNSLSVTTTGNNMQGAMTFGSTVTINGNVNLGTTATSVYSDAIRSFTTGSAANVFINSTTGIMARSTASSQRYKHDIVNLTDVPELDPKKLYDLPVRAFRFNQDYLPESDDRYDVLVPGFIAEEIDAIYPIGADYAGNNEVETWNDRMIIPAMLSLIQDLNTRVQTLEG